MAGNAREAGRSVLSRVFDLLDAFDAGHRRLGLTELAERAGVPLSTAHRLVAELEAWRALRRGPDGRYEVGVRLWELGQLSGLTVRLRAAALPVMEQLCAESGDNVHLAVRDGADALFVERLRGPASVAVVARSGGRLPLHATGVGKVLLAAAGGDFLRTYAEGGLERVTRLTVVEPGRLARDLAETRERGWASTSEEMTLGTYSVAVPIAPDTQVVAALGVVGRDRRLVGPHTARRLLRAAAEVERRLREPLEIDRDDRT